MKYKIAVIVCYFGHFPTYFNQWLKSCSFNNTIDFLIYTDCQWDGKTPSNVHIKKTNLKAIKEKAECAVGFDVTLQKPYKLCDFRPAFGMIFKNDLLDYDFWGYCDLDMIAGDIRGFITDDILEKYDKINRWGHLCFVRNTDECNSRYMLDGTRYNYKTILTHTRDYGFDECDLTNIYIKHDFPLYILPDSAYADIRARYSRFCVQGKDNYPFQLFFWDNGHVYRAYWKNNKINYNEYLYIHFKKRGDLPVHFASELNSFLITNSGFYEKNEISISTIRKYNNYPGKLYEKIEDTKYKISSTAYKAKRKFFE